MEEKILIIKHTEKEGPGLIQNFFSDNGWRSETIELSNGDSLPKNPEEYAALIILGGPMNVYEVDSYPFLSEEEVFIKKALLHETPMLGICLGAQMIAKTCGAKVLKAQEKEIGWYEVEPTKEGKKDLLFRDSKKPLLVFQWHEDTFEIPKKGTLLAKGNYCKNQAFKFGNNAYGIQFHIEVTPEMIESWLEDGMVCADIKRIQEDTIKNRELFERQANAILSNFKTKVSYNIRYKKIIKDFIEDYKRVEKKPINWWEKDEQHNQH